MIKVEAERQTLSSPEANEDCCFCWKPTLFWVAPVTGDSVAVCESCAATHELKDVPTKQQWYKQAEAREAKV